MYETSELTHRQMKGFIAKFDEQVGTSRSVSKIGKDVYYVTCTELEGTEAQTCKDIESRV